jgi:hypothetical protein
VLDGSAGALEPPRTGAGAILTPVLRRRQAMRTSPRRRRERQAGGDANVRPAAMRTSGAGETALLLLRELLVGQHALIVQFAQLL